MKRPDWVVRKRPWGTWIAFNINQIHFPYHECETWEKAMRIANASARGENLKSQLKG